MTLRSGSGRRQSARAHGHPSRWDRIARGMMITTGVIAGLVVLSTLRAELLSHEMASPSSLVLSAAAVSVIALGFWRTNVAMILLIALTPLTVLLGASVTGSWVFTAFSACFLLLRGAYPALALGAVVSGYVATASTTGWLASEAILALTTIAALVLAAWLVLLALAREESADEARESDIRRRLAEERLRIARDLHDTVGHQVAALSMSIGIAEVSAPDSAPPALGEALSAARRSVQSINGETQRILEVMRAGSVDGTMSPVADAAGIPDLVESFRKMGMDIRATLAALPTDIDREASTALYRMAQEAMTNVEKHGVGPVQVDLTVENDSATLTVTNALTATVSSRSVRNGLGLVGMRERLASAGGTMSIARTETRFTVVGEVPLRRRHTR